MKYLAFTLFLIGALTSCEKETYYEYFLDNKSSSNITITGNDLLTDNSINSNENSKMAIFSHRSKTTEPNNPASVLGNDLVITNAAGDTLKKDYKLISNWTSSIEDNRATASHKYTLSIVDADF